MTRIALLIALMLGCTGSGEAYAQEKDKSKKECKEKVCDVTKDKDKSGDIQVQQTEIQERLQKLLEQQKGSKPE